MTRTTGRLSTTTPNEVTARSVDGRVHDPIAGCVRQADEGGQRARAPAGGCIAADNTAETQPTTTDPLWTAIATVNVLTTAPLTREALRRQVDAVVAPHGLSVDDFVTSAIDDLPSEDLRDGWLMVKGALAPGNELPRDDCGTNSVWPCEQKADR